MIIYVPESGSRKENTSASAQFSQRNEYKPTPVYLRNGGARLAARTGRDVRAATFARVPLLRQEGQGFPDQGLDRLGFHPAPELASARSASLAR